MSNGHRIFLSSDGDDRWLAASIDSPRFCVGASSGPGVVEKSLRALEYYHSVKDSLRTVAPLETRVVSPVYEEKELCVE